MIVLDTTVLVYAKGAEHPLRDPCRDLVAAIADERIAATTTAEVIQEFVHVRARRRDRSDAAALAAPDYAELSAATHHQSRPPRSAATLENRQGFGRDAVLGGCRKRRRDRSCLG
ncbi:hypothetical protein J113_04715 [Mycobacterium tuberculosis CAS/NITR204]|uniref:PIN domain-containing protein n=1 Tax=Mycobacterium tuberculosis CAS/NITR204 TaxID=1310114 RepID=R4MAI9_MYCTX|nr:hypothetical protein J113_04715 [Mycobacterium tuberculosis CAS/NITR204]